MKTDSASRAPADTLRERLASAIRECPGDLPGANRSSRRLLVFAPHPDDDVISMGGTLGRLCDAGHEVHVAYQVSGAGAVAPDFLSRQMDFAAEALRILALPGEIPPPENLPQPLLRELAAAVRRAEARSGAAVVGVPAGRCHFLNLPFYDREGRATDGDDVAIIRELLRALRPEQIYAAGDLADPHGTHRVCLDLIRTAVRAEYEGGGEWLAATEFWLYSGAWDSCPLEEIAMAVPLTPPEIARRRSAILRHQSQKDETPFPGADPREFWQRVEERTRENAGRLADMGFPLFPAVETFARWHPLDDDSAPLAA